jgi:hypothetical protein
MDSAQVCLKAPTVEYRDGDDESLFLFPHAEPAGHHILLLSRKICKHETARRPIFVSAR